MKKASTNREKLLLYRADKDIEQRQIQLINTQPIVQAVINAYTSIEGLPALDTDGLHKLFSGRQYSLDDLQLSWYVTKYGESHQAIGITASAGMKMVNLVDLTQIITQLDQYFKLTAYVQGSSSYLDYCGYDFFLVEDHTAVINQEMVKAEVEAMSVYVTEDRHFELLDRVNEFISAFYNLNDAANLNHQASLIPENASYFEQGLNVSNLISFEYGTKALSPNLLFFTKLIKGTR